MMDVTPQKLKEEMTNQTPMDIVDLQDAHAYQESHVPGAINIPLEQFEADYPALLKDKDIVVVLYGEFDELGKGGKAGAILEAAGYTKVGHVVGGIHGWKDAGYPAEGGMDS